MEPEEKQQLSQVKELIQQKRFDDARLILQSMPFNETAQKWLEKLDQVTVQQRAAIPGTNEPSQVKDPFKPLNPSMYFGVRLFFIAGMVLGPLAVGFFALNWKRLGKPEWSLETFLLGVFLGVGAVASLALMLAGVVDETVGLIAALLFALGNAVLTMFLADVQKSAYDTWKIGGRQALMQHDYQISRKFMLSGGLKPV